MHLQRRLDKLSAAGLFKVRDKESFAIDNRVFDNIRECSRKMLAQGWDKSYSFMKGLWAFLLFFFYIFMFISGYDILSFIYVLVYQMLGGIILSFVYKVGSKYIEHMSGDMTCAIVEGEFGKIQKIFRGSEALVLPSDTTSQQVNIMSMITSQPNVYLVTLYSGVPAITLIGLNKKFLDDASVSKNLDMHV